MPPSPPIHLLVVDDHAIVREGIHQLVQRQWPDSQVSQAGDLAQAHAVLAARPDVTLVLLDVHLPHSEPLQALRDLRQRHPMLPVAMLSADTDAAVALQALRLGAAGYLPKSADTHLLTRALQLVLDGNCYVPPFLVRPAAPTGTTETLTPRQRQVLACLVRGLTNKEIARELDLAEPTVKAHVVTIFRVLKVRNRAQAALAGQDFLSAHL